MEKIRLELIGITYNQIESGVYALVLQQMGGTTRIPIIIGYPEAQSIECKLQDVVTPRPLTHDLMVNSLSAFGITIEEVNIRRLPSGIFAATLLLRDSSGDTRIVDSRSSDAIALAIRVDAPIYTTSDVLEEAGFEPSGQAPRRSAADAPGADKEKGKAPRTLAQLTLKELETAMQTAAENENYEEAARIKQEITRRNNEE